MGLADNLKLTAISLIAKYGNVVVLQHDVNDGVYNPQTGSYGVPVSNQYSRKAYVKPVTTKELQSLGEGAWGDVVSIATMVEDAEILDLDNTWTFNGSKIIKVIKTEAQDTSIVIKVFCG